MFLYSIIIWVERAQCIKHCSFPAKLGFVTPLSWLCVDDSLLGRVLLELCQADHWFWRLVEEYKKRNNKKIV